MRKKLFPLVLTFMLVMFHAKPQAVCTFADLAVSTINITNVSGNSFTFTYQIKNVGAATLYLDRFYFQAYVSQNAVYDATDQPAGGSIFSTSSIALAPGQTYTGTWTSNPFVSITTYPYLVYTVQLRSGYLHPECSTSNNILVKYIGCNLADLDVSNITINSVSGNSFNFTYTVKNLGWAPLPLSKMYFQAWVSTDAVLDATDKPAGGSIFGTTAPTLAKDGTYSGTWTSNPTVSITSYKYLILEVKVISGNTVPECNTANNVEVKYIGCNLSDLDVTNITINSITGNSFNFTYTVTNLGWAPLPLSKMYFQAWVSTDAVLDATDKPAGGRIFGTTVPDLAKGATYSGSWTSNPTVSIATYKYLIMEVKVISGNTVAECNTANNVQAKLITLPLVVVNNASETGELKSLRAIYNAQDQSLSLSNNDEQETLYKVYKLDGQLVGELHAGSFIGTKDIALPNLAPGLYIVNMSDGKASLAEKFVVTQ
jgi:hypothetical protein